jgi:hypothetical protein
MVPFAFSMNAGLADAMPGRPARATKARPAKSLEKSIVGFVGGFLKDGSQKITPDTRKG